MVRCEKVRCKTCRLSNGAGTIKDLLFMECINHVTELSFDDLKGTSERSLRFDFGIYNNNNSLLGIIEYDGGFHDTDELVMLHDKLKNDYCIKNRIPLLRIHHSSSYEILKIYDFLIEIKCNMPLGKILDVRNKTIKEIEDKISIMNKQVADIQNKKYELEKLINGY